MANGLVSKMQGLLNGHASVPGYPLPDSRPFTLSHHQTNSRLTLQVPEKDYVAAEILKDAFLYYLEQDRDARTAFASDEVSENEDEQPSALKSQKEILLLALFMRFAAHPARSSKNSRAQGNLSVLFACLLHFTVHFLDARKQDIHALASDFDSEQRRVLIRCYYEAKIALEELTDYHVPQGPISLLFTQEREKPTIQALFGGQGMNEVYFNELQVRFWHSRTSNQPHVYPGPL
jgi:fatty acid synthase subunit beta